MTTVQRHEISETCHWCTRQVTSFAGPPFMVRVHAHLDSQFDHRWRICLGCYTDLITLIAAAPERAHADDQPLRSSPPRC
jgi:hypothetical protein